MSKLIVNPGGYYSTIWNGNIRTFGIYLLISKTATYSTNVRVVNSIGGL